MIDNAPTQAGVYKFINREGKIIYVGKAKNLKNRLVSYFAGRQVLAKKTADLNNALSDVKRYKDLYESYKAKNDCLKQTAGASETC